MRAATPQRTVTRKQSAGFCCQVPADPALPCYRQGLRSKASRRITQREEHLQHSCHLQLLVGPITAVPCRAKFNPLHPRRSCFAPITTRLAGGFWWRRRVLPPGPMGLLRLPFIAIAVASPANIVARALQCKEMRGERFPRACIRWSIGHNARRAGGCPRSHAGGDR